MSAKAVVFCEGAPQRGCRLHLSYDGHGVRLNSGKAVLIARPTPSAAFILSLSRYEDGGATPLGSSRSAFPKDFPAVWEYRCEIFGIPLSLRFFTEEEASKRGVFVSPNEWPDDSPSSHPSSYDPRYGSSLDIDEDPFFRHHRFFAQINHSMREANTKWEISTKDAALKNEVAVLLQEMEQADEFASSAATGAGGSGKSAALEANAKRFAAAAEAMAEEAKTVMKKYFKVLKREQIKAVFWSVLRNGVEPNTRLMLWVCCLSLPPSPSRNTLMVATSDSFTTNADTLLSVSTTLASL
jgi:hypothetical protein